MRGTRDFLRFIEAEPVSTFMGGNMRLLTNLRLRGFSVLGTLGLLLLSGCDRGGSGVSGTRQNIAWVENFNAALERAKTENKPVMVDFFATWCGPCRQMESQTYTDASVASELTNWISAKIDVDKNQEVAQRFGIQAIPTTVLLEPSGKEIARESGYLGPQQFVSFVKKARPGAQAPK